MRTHHGPTRTAAPPSFPDRLAAFSEQLAPALRPGVSAEEQCGVLHRLVQFAADTAAAGDLPVRADQHGAAPYGLVWLCDTHRFALAGVVLDIGQATPPHDHESWGAAATVVGIESNRRFRGRCPDALTLVDEQLVPVGGGYLFGAAEIHRAAQYGAAPTISLHLLVRDDLHTRSTGQRCAETPRDPPSTPRPTQSAQGRR